MESCIASIKLDDENSNTEAFDFTRLPEKVLTQMFQYLNVNQLLQIRSTCRSWKETIDHSVAMNMILLKFPENLVLDRKYRPPTLVPARNECFTKSRISAVDLWWPLVGEKIIELRVDDCQISYAMLLKMLKLCPNLKSLEYLCPSYPAASVSTGDMKMERLEHLKIDNATIFGIVHDFVKMCPNLKTLKLPQQIDGANKMQHIEVLKDILVEVNIRNFTNITDQINHLKCLQYLHIGNEVTTDSILQKVTGAFPQLKGITVNITSEKPVVLNFLDALVNLETLSIESNAYYKITGGYTNWTSVNFTKFNGKNLRKLYFYRLYPVQFSLQQILKESSNLQEIIFNVCQFQSWSEIFSLAEKHKMLQRLELISITVENSNCCLSEYFDNLKYLKLNNCSLPKQLLVTFFSLCSALEDVILDSIPNVDDDVILELLQSSDRLKKLTVNNCSITDVSVDNIGTHGLMLKQLSISNCNKVTAGALEKLKII